MKIGISIFGSNTKRFEHVKKKLDEILPVKDDENLLPQPDVILEKEILNNMALLALEK